MMKNILSILLIYGLIFASNIILLFAQEKEDSGMVLPRFDIKPPQAGREGNAGYIVGIASWYSEIESENEHTASGEFFDDDALTCAMRDRNFGKSCKITNLDNGKFVIVRHNDFGPSLIYQGRKLNRAIDLSKRAFRKIADLKTGLIKVKIERM